MVTTADWFHCSVEAISRSANRTAIAPAAYRTGTRLRNEELKKSPGIEAAAYRTGTQLADKQTPDPEITDYTRKRGVLTWFIVAPENAPEWAYDLERLWNEAQAKDTRVNSRVARECVLALPDALGPEKREQIVRDFAEHLVDRYGVAATVALHAPSRHGDDRNWHAHVMFTTRRMDENGFGKKTRELDDRVTGPKEIKHIRETAADIINVYLEEAGIDERVDHRSFKDRGIDRKPTEHMGVDASAMERRGERSDIGEKNRQAREHNEKLDAYDHHIQNYQEQLDERMAEIAEIEAEIARELKKEFLEPEPEIEVPSFPDDREAHSPDESEPATSLFDDPISKRFEQELREKGYIGEPVPDVDDVEAELEEPEYSYDGEEEEYKPDYSPPAFAHLEPDTNLFESPLSKRFERELQEFGEIQEYGLGKNWFDRTVAFWQSLYDDTTTLMKDTWQKYVTDRREKESSPGQESGLWNETVDRVKGFWQKYVTDKDDSDKNSDRDDIEPEI